MTRWFALLAVIGAPAFASPDYSNGISGEDAANLVAAAMEAYGLTTGAPDAPIRPLPACGHTPTITPLNGSWSTAELRCTDPVWQRGLRTRAALAVPLRDRSDETPDTPAPLVVVLTRSLQAGDMITADDLALIPGSTQNARDIFTQIDQVIGRRLRTSLGVEQILLTRHLEPDWIVQSGTPIALQITAGPITVIASGEALEGGRVGDVIALRNLSSGQVVKGIVIGENSVALRPNID